MRRSQCKYIQEPLRKRFGHALRWFGALENLVSHHVQQAIDDARATLPQPQEPPSNPATPNRDDHTPDDDQAPNVQPTQGSVSSYLRQRCPICFGKVFARHAKYVTFPFFSSYTANADILFSTTVPDIIVCADANFTQKRLKKPTPGPPPPDVPRHHPDTVFLSRELVAEMATLVEAQRGGNASGAKATTNAEDDVEDSVEPGLKVPASVLDGCGKTFIAADEKREKASTKLFADTGLMALLCRHDIAIQLQRHPLAALYCNIYYKSVPNALQYIAPQIHCNTKLPTLQYYIRQAIKH